ncbi:hypothetical protein WN944_022879 [Citrus x changshan-huyou]|uniref:Uncharacterized protein n=1 Tax=Citrus x changshan-huyou TaxID=2935761 RepID=A0AAP0N1H5_9ROSI
MAAARNGYHRLKIMATRNNGVNQTAIIGESMTGQNDGENGRIRRGISVRPSSCPSCFPINHFSGCNFFFFPPWFLLI